MDIGLSHKHIQKLAVDEIAVVFFIRLLFSCGFTFAAVLIVSALLVKTLRENLCGPAIISSLVLTLLTWLGWIFSKLFIIRTVLRQRPRSDLTHTPTFILWAKATHVVAIISLMHPLLQSWLSARNLEIFTTIAWMLDWLMACFYAVYLGLLLLVWQRPPLVVVSAIVFALAGTLWAPHFRFWE